MMQEFEVDWYKELTIRYAKGEKLSDDDIHRLSYLRNKYVCMIADHPPAEALHNSLQDAYNALRLAVRHPGEAAEAFVDRVVRERYVER